jgi:hypothetical protein
VTLKFAFTSPGDPKYSIMQRILDGTLAVRSAEELKEVLDIYPEDPFLHRKYADLLYDTKRADEAATAYDEASRLFIANGMNLQAVVAKILQWRIQKTDHDKGRAFHHLLRKEGRSQTPLQHFWANMSYAELVAVMRRLLRIRLPAGRTLTRADEPAENLYFVVFGTLYEMPSPECQSEARLAGVEVEPVLLGPNDVFGDVFPLSHTTVTDTEIRTATDVELIRISKSVLGELCHKYPRIETVLTEIRKPENRENCDRPWQTVRRAMRFGLPTKAEITCPAIESGQKHWHHAGIAVDLSLGGLCLDLADAPLPSHKKGLKGRLVQVKLDLLNEVAILNLTGKVVWQKRQNKAEGPFTLIGIRFDPLNAMDRDMLAEYCSGSVGEQNLLWGLWDTMVKPD